MKHLDYIYSKFTHARLFYPSDFGEFNNPPMVHTLLAQLVKRGRITRVRHGVYAKRGSRWDPKMLQRRVKTPPVPDEIDPFAP